MTLSINDPMDTFAEMDNDDLEDDHDQYEFRDYEYDHRGQGSSQHIEVWCFP